jgi:tetratricopeptide (TPR) repeat protein
MSEIKKFTEHFIGRYLKLIGINNFRLPKLTLPYPILIMAGLLVAVISFYWQKNSFGEAKMKLGGSPTQPEAYFELAGEAAKKYDYELAELMYRQGLRMTGEANQRQVLGWASEIWETVFPDQAIEAEIDYWKTILEEQPTYRDGLLRLAVLYRKLGDEQAAKEYWSLAVKLDPNNETVKEVGSWLEENKK